MLDAASTAYLTALNEGNLDEADRLRAVLDTADELERRRIVNLTHTALAYAELGIAVFPLRPRDKRPLTSHGFKDATTDTRLIRDWWAATPDANIGLPTGLLFDVFDIDGTDGLAGMYNGDIAAIDHLDIIGHALTSRPGGHHLYVPPTGRGNGASIMPGVDYRGVGGYVVAPPSVGANGRRYLWTKQLTVRP